jgi:hypothetical protein
MGISHRPILRATAAILVLSASPALAAGAAAASGADIIGTTTLASLLELEFGTIAADSAGGVVELDVSSGNRNCAPGMACSGSFAFATLLVTGSAGSVEVTYDPTVILAGPGADLNATINFPGGQGSVINLVNGTATVQFGASLQINPNQAAGQYIGQFSVNVNYF